jgi:hypothetical protein
VLLTWRDRLVILAVAMIGLFTYWWRAEAFDSNRLSFSISIRKVAGFKPSAIIQKDLSEWITIRMIEAIPVCCPTEDYDGMRAVPINYLRPRGMSRFTGIGVLGRSGCGEVGAILRNNTATRESVGGFGHNSPALEISEDEMAMAMDIYSWRFSNILERYVDFDWQPRLRNYNSKGIFLADNQFKFFNGYIWTLFEFKGVPLEKQLLTRIVCRLGATLNAVFRSHSLPPGFPKTLDHGAELHITGSALLVSDTSVVSSGPKSAYSGHAQQGLNNKVRYVVPISFIVLGSTLIFGVFFWIYRYWNLRSCAWVIAAGIPAAFISICIGTFMLLDALAVNSRF